MVPPVFNTGEVEHLGLAGSIPVRLRHRPGRRVPSGMGTMQGVTPTDPRRLIPRTDHLLALPAVAAARPRLGDRTVRGLVRDLQERARRGEIGPAEVEPALLSAVARPAPTGLTPVLNATGVVVHTNLGRAPLSAAALEALGRAAGYVDVELDLATGTRARRGATARAALLAACPAAEDALVVNNGAAALVLATTALAAGREVVVSRGELIEIGAGFRLPDLIASTGARLREVGTTNRTHLRDYADAVGPDTGCLLKVHPSNFRIEGFTSAVEVADLRELAVDRGLPLVVDIGSGLLAPDPLLPDEPDAATALAAGADLVTASGDKLLGGPQAGIVLGRAEAVARLARHPLARAVRADKLTLAALEATVAGAPPPVAAALHADPERLRARATRLAAAIVAATGGPAAGVGATGNAAEGPGVRAGGAGRQADPGGPGGSEAGADSAGGSEAGADSGGGGGGVGGALVATVVPHDGRVGGGGAPGVPLPGGAVRLPVAVAPRLRAGRPAVLPRVHDGACLVDLRCIPEGDDEVLLAAILAAVRAAVRPTDEGTAGGGPADGAGDTADVAEAAEAGEVGDADSASEIGDADSASDADEVGGAGGLARGAAAEA